MRNARLDEAQARIKIAGRNINNLRYADDTTLMAESEEELKSLLMKVKEESEKAGLKLSIQKTKIMASSLITLWQIDGETIETVTAFIFLGSKITPDGEAVMKLKDCLLLRRKAMTNLDSILLYYIITLTLHVIQFSSVTQSCPTLCDHMNCSMPGFPVHHHQLPEFTQTHVHQASDAIQQSHPLSFPSPPSFNLSQHQGLSK